MNRSSKLPKVFLHLATLVMLLNASAGYGACCFNSLDQVGNNDAAIDLVADGQPLPPCHRTAKNSKVKIDTTQPHNISANDSISADTCCLISLAMVPTLHVTQDPTKLNVRLHIGTTSSPLSGTLTPLLRPPIS